MSSDCCCCLTMRGVRKTKASTRHRFILHTARGPGVLAALGGQFSLGALLQVGPGAIGAAIV